MNTMEDSENSSPDSSPPVRADTARVEELARSLPRTEGIRRTGSREVEKAALEFG